tara:strand:- start:141 stop:665 length:525 start_codon:yes stop_codon:yes gene_type:complete
MKLAIIGKMGSGKSTCAEYLNKNHDFKILSFGGPVKKYVQEIFNDTTKNRELIQTFAQKIKEIDKDVWVNHLLRNIKDSENIIIDDVRFPNEYNALEKAGFKFIKLNITDEFQIERLIDTYPENYNSHISRCGDISESYVDLLHADYFYNVNKKTESKLNSSLDNIVKNLDIKD